MVQTMERLEFVRRMIVNLRQALLDGNLTVASASSSAGSVTYRDFGEMMKALNELEAEEKQLTAGPNLGPVIRTADMRRASG